MPSSPTLVRVLVGSVLVAAMTASAVAPSPGDLPAVALGQQGLYRLEIGLAVFYGCLLIVTPAYSGLVIGRLPIEISTRGARFVEEAERSAERDEIATRALEQAAHKLSEEMAMAINELDQRIETKHDAR